MACSRSTHLVLFFLGWRIGRPNMRLRLIVSEVGRVAASITIFYQVVRPDHRNVQPNLTTSNLAVPGTYLATSNLA